MGDLVEELSTQEVEELKELSTQEVEVVVRSNQTSSHAQDRNVVIHRHEYFMCLHSYLLSVICIKSIVIFLSKTIKSESNVSKQLKTEKN